MLITPWIIAFITIPNLFSIYFDAENIKVLPVVLFFSAMYGVAVITFGLGLAYLGLALAYSLNMALIIIVGTLVPIVFADNLAGFLDNIKIFLQFKGQILILGIAVVVVSLIINAIAAVRREKDYFKQIDDNKPKEQKTFFKGLILCLITGFCAPGLSYAFIYGEKLRITAENMGVSKALSTNAIMPMAHLGTAIVIFAYCGWLLTKNKTWKLYIEKGTGKYYTYTIFMGIAAIGVALFAVASANMGEFGYSVGWAVINASSIFWANIAGLLTGEWKGVSKKTILTMLVGLCVLIVGISIIGWTNSLN